MRDEVVRLAERVALDAPHGLASDHLRRQVVEHVGGEGAGDASLEVTLGAVVEQRLRCRHPGGGVGDVVREHLTARRARRSPRAHGSRLRRPGRRGRWRRPRRERRGAQSMPEVMAARLLGGNPPDLFGGGRPRRACDDVTRGEHRCVLRIELRYRSALSRGGGRCSGERSPTGGHRLVYGGGHVGLMGAIADAALADGGEVIGVITEHLVGAEVAHTAA